VRRTAKQLSASKRDEQQARSSLAALTVREQNVRAAHVELVAEHALLKRAHTAEQDVVATQTAKLDRLHETNETLRRRVDKKATQVNELKHAYSVLERATTKDAAQLRSQCAVLRGEKLDMESRIMRFQHEHEALTTQRTRHDEVLAEHVAQADTDRHTIAELRTANAVRVALEVKRLTHALDTAERASDAAGHAAAALRVSNTEQHDELVELRACVKHQAAELDEARTTRDAAVLAHATLDTKHATALTLAHRMRDDAVARSKLLAERIENIKRTNEAQAAAAVTRFGATRDELKKCQQARLVATQQLDTMKKRLAAQQEQFVLVTKRLELKYTEAKRALHDAQSQSSSSSSSAQ
jgi:hypothetical protein